MQDRPSLSGDRLESALTRRLSDEDALALADLGDLGDLDGPDGTGLEPLFRVAGAVRDRAFGRVLTFSPKVFLPITNLCRNHCDYCSFRKSPGDEGEWTMRPDEITSWLARAREQGCVEALFCLGDKPEGAFGAYRKTLQSFGQESTVEYLHYAGKKALELGLLPHTNAGVLTLEEMARLKEVNVSLGLMLENVSPRLCEPGMPHWKAPDKRPERRLKMIAEAGQLRIPFTTGILIGIGETRRERVESLLAIRKLHREYGHIQEVIVQNFRAQPDIPMSGAVEPDDLEIAHAVAMARLILDEEVGVQAPPNLNPAGIGVLIRAGINDFGGISPVSPDYINKGHPWPHLDALARSCADAGFELKPRLPIYPGHVKASGFLVDDLRGPTAAAEARMTSAPAFLTTVRAGANDDLARRVS